MGMREMLALGTVERATEKDQTDEIIRRHSVRRRCARLRCVNYEAQAAKKLILKPLNIS